MVRVIDPKIGETVYDPGCGTGGFKVRLFSMKSRELRVCKVSENLEKGIWPGTESNCRHEDFQKSKHLGTIGPYRSLCVHIPLVDAPYRFSLLPFFPIQTFRSDKVISKAKRHGFGIFLFTTKRTAWSCCGVQATLDEMRSILV
jgi:hypothetical protein